MTEQIVDLIDGVMPGPRGVVGPRGEQGLPGVNAVPADSAVAGYIHADESATRSALGLLNLPRRFVVFGDSWTTTLDGVNIPQTAIQLIGGTLVKNYGVGGASIATQEHANQYNMTNVTSAQCATAQSDSVDRSSITDVLVLCGVNNLGGAYKPTVAQAVEDMAQFRLYPRARYWYVANSKNCQNSDDAWAWYSVYIEAASQCGFAVAQTSPMWNWGVEADSWWPSTANDGSRHMNAAGQTMWARRLAAFLSGGASYSPNFRPEFTMSQDLLALVPDATVQNRSTIQDGTLYVDLTFIGRKPDHTGTTDILAGRFNRRYANVRGSQYRTLVIRESSQSVIDSSQIRNNGNRIWYLNAMGAIYIDAQAIRRNKGFYVLQGSVALTQHE